jgi:hypothetical protein
MSPGVSSVGGQMWSVERGSPSPLCIYHAGARLGGSHARLNAISSVTSGVPRTSGRTACNRAGSDFLCEG